MHRCCVKTVSALLLLLVATYAAAQRAVTLEKCQASKDYPELKEVTIDPCDSDPCVIKRGERYNVTFKAEATSDADNIQVTTIKQQQSGPIHINMMSTVSCYFMDVPCNVTNGEVFRGSLELTLLQIHPPGELFYHIKVRSGTEVFACGKTTVTVE